MVSTHMRGAVIPTSVHKGFPRACTLRSVAYSSTLLISNKLTPSWELGRHIKNYE